MVTKKLLTEKYYGDFEPGQLVLAKMASYPPWPAFIARFEYVPKKVFRKRSAKNTIPVMYVPEGNFSWAKEKDITVLTEKMITQRLKGKKKQTELEKQLDSSYEHVKDGYTYDDFREFLEDDTVNDLFDSEEVKEEDTDAVQNGDVIKIEPSIKKRKIYKKEEHEDELEAEAEANAGSDSKVDEGSTIKDASSEEVQTFEQENSNDDNNNNNNDNNNDDDHRDIVWQFRYKLQKKLIQRKTEPDQSSIDESEAILNELNEFHENHGVSVDHLKFSKLHKVLKEILKKEHLSQLHDQCKVILEKWVDLITELRKAKHVNGSIMGNSNGNGNGNGNGFENTSMNSSHARDLSDISDINTIKTKI